MSEQPAIMVVEDDPDISDAIASALEEHGFSVIVAGNGREALDKLRTARPLPRLILLDLMMPVMDGRQFREAQLADPALAHVPVALLSAHVDLRAQAEQLAASAWLKKPVTLAALLELVSRSWPTA